MSAIETPEAAYVRLDLFPAQVTPPIPGFDDKDLRVVITDRDLLVLGDTNTGPQIVQQYTIEEYPGRDKDTKSWSVLTDQGDTVQVSRKQSCGCGSLLRGASIYPSIPRKVS